LLVVGLLGFVNLVGLGSAANAHFAGFTDGDTQDWYIPPGGSQYLVNSSGGRLTHSFSFDSSNDLGGTNYVCAVIDPPGSNNADGECGNDFERYCWYQYTHSSNDLDCHDRDGNSWWAYGQNLVPPYVGGTTVRIHGTW